MWVLAKYGLDLFLSVTSPRNPDTVYILGALGICPLEVVVIPLLNDRLPLTTDRGFGG